jgi:selenocysteine-specific translation elongation factor SelB
VIVGTAGHIDHGKTSLLRALTGIQGDRRPAERERGITIDLGYLYADLGDGALTGFIDVPGHERFVHNMLAGASGIDLVLLVVAADDGVMPHDPRAPRHRPAARYSPCHGRADQGGSRCARTLATGYCASA